MTYTVIIPARLASSRLPNKPLADIHGKPMVVRVAECALRSKAKQVVVAADSAAIVDACKAHGVQALLTRQDHLSGTDRLAEASELLGLADDAVVINVQGDEPQIDAMLIDACAACIQGDTMMSTVAHPILSEDEFRNPNAVKVVLDRHGRALLFSRAPLPWWRDGSTTGTARMPAGDATTGALKPLRHVGLYGYRAGFLRQVASMDPSPLEKVESLEQLRVLWHGHRIAVHVTHLVPEAGVDTPDDLERVRRVWAGA
jgi:3-deoxy-manno-octulosonate cytidylyltransferase (CMP-KDO synthetase)